MWDLMCGIAPRHIHSLCSNSWDGGRQYTPDQVGNMTLDQIFFVLAEKGNLRLGAEIVTAVDSLVVVGIASKAGIINGRDADGNPIKGRIAGKSKARQLMEAAEARRIAEIEAEKRAKEQQQKAERRQRRRGQNTSQPH